jgi:hypothetical protein
MIGGLISGINSIFAGGKQKKASKKINPKDVTYEVSPYAQEQLDNARAEKNARMPGAAQAERNIYQNQANALANMGRNSTDSSQLLAMAGGVQGQSNDAFGNLGVADAQNRQMNVQNLNNALGVMTGENDKVYQDKLRKYQEAYNAKMALMNAGITNQANGLNQIGSTIDNAAMMAASMMTGGLAGGAEGAGGLMSGLMGGGKSAGAPSGATSYTPAFSQTPPAINYSLLGRPTYAQTNPYYNRSYYNATNG